VRADYLSVSEVASQLGISRAAVYSAIREGRLDSDVVLGKIAITKTALSRYKPNTDRVRAAKIRVPTSSFVLMEALGTKERKEGVELINLDLLLYAHCNLGESPSIYLTFAQGRTRSYRDAACLAIFRELTGRPNIVELSRDSGADLINVNQIANVVFTPETSVSSASLFVEFLTRDAGLPVSHGREADSAWKLLKDIASPHIISTRTPQQAANTRTG
jgi:excisionase family DNA binding protein